MVAQPVASRCTDRAVAYAHSGGWISRLHYRAPAAAAAAVMLIVVWRVCRGSETNGYIVLLCCSLELRLATVATDPSLGMGSAGLRWAPLGSADAHASGDITICAYC
jgi:hypothetical protein